MRLYHAVAWGGGLVALAMGGCYQPVAVTCMENKPAGQVVVIRPSPNVHEVAQEALIKAKPGDTVEFAEGTFEFPLGLSLRVNGVTVRGKGMDKTILSFKKQEADPAGLFVKADAFAMEDLTVDDAKKDAVKVEGGNGVTFRRVRARWTEGAKSSNGPYGIYPVQCKNVLIEDCVAIGASDAGIYVGQSETIVVRRCRAEGNVAGIEIENSADADVYENVATGNTGGLLVFDLPGLPVKNGKRIRVFRNQVYGNNHPNFAPKGVKVAKVAPGTGMMVMATDQVEVFENQVRDNQTVNLAIVSYLLTSEGTEKEKDAEYDPYPENIYVHDNEFSGGGGKPAGPFGLMFGALLGTPLPDILYDGILSPRTSPGGRQLYLRDNGPATFADIQWADMLPALKASKNEMEGMLKIVGHKSKVIRDAKAYEGELPRLKPVALSGRSE
jgi:parallel beta-helix repeat protein